MKRTVTTVLGSALVAAATAGCGAEPAAHVQPPRPVRVAAVERYAGGGMLRYSASVEPVEQVPLAFKVSGYVTEVLRQRGADGRARHVQGGDLVSRGIVLARVREEDYREAANQTAAQLAEAQASLAKATEDHQRASTLFERGSATKPELDGAVAQLDAAKARVDAARASLARSRLTVGDAALGAPFDGVLLARNIEAGSLVSAGQTAFLIGDVRRVKVVFGVPDVLVGRVRTGARLEIMAEATGAAVYEGVVTAVSPQGDSQTRLFTVELTVENPRNALRPGMVATVQVPEEGRQAASNPLIVPLSAIVKAPESGYAVFVIERGGNADVARLRKVALGDVLGNTIAVDDGLRPGERVIVTGATLVRDSEPVRVLPGA